MYLDPILLPHISCHIHLALNVFFKEDNSIVGGERINCTRNIGWLYLQLDVRDIISISNRRVSARHLLSFHWILAWLLLKWMEDALHHPSGLHPKFTEFFLHLFKLVQHLVLARCNCNLLYLTKICWCRKGV